MSDFMGTLFMIGLMFVGMAAAVLALPRFLAGLSIIVQ